MTYLVDVNLPISFLQINTITCLFVKDISDEMPDSEIWQMAIANNYVILTRDKDFYHRAVQSKVLPKIVLFRLGNIRNRELLHYFKENISAIEEQLALHQLLVLWPHEVQVVI
jgi:predicted nuclease of predicted toxin-antitoxin system